MPRLIAHLLPVMTLLLVFAAPLPAAHAKEPFTLESIQRDIESRYKGVRQLSGDQLAAMMQAGKDVLLLDVREKPEFQVSRINGAKQVAPGIWKGQFLKRFAEQAKGRTVVFYCSVGVRSSKLAQYVGDALRESGAGLVYNLKGGIFAWHNAKRPLTDQNGETPYVHPYDSYWGQLVERQAFIRTTPE